MKQGYIFAAAALAVVAVPIMGAIDGQAFAQQSPLTTLFGNAKGKTKAPPPPPPPPPAPPPKASQPPCPKQTGPNPGNSAPGNPTRPCNKSPK